MTDSDGEVAGGGENLHSCLSAFGGEEGVRVVAMVADTSDADLVHSEMTGRVAGDPVRAGYTLMMTVAVPVPVSWGVVAAAAHQVAEREPSRPWYRCASIFY